MNYYELKAERVRVMALYSLSTSISERMAYIAMLIDLDEKLLITDKAAYL